MIRVLHVLGGMNQGGVENFLINMYRCIDRNKIQFDFLVNREGVFDEEIKKLGGKVYYIPSLQTIGQVKYVKNLDDFFKNHPEYQIIHSHINQVSGLILERAKKANIPVRIAHSHNNKYGKNIFIVLYKSFLKTKIKDNANYRFACSYDAGKFLFGDLDFKICPNFIDANKFLFNSEVRNKVRKKFKIADNCMVLGNVGRLCYQKNPLFLIKIFLEFHNLEPNSKLIIIGKGKLKHKIDELISKLNLNDDIIILENRNDVNELMQAMDYFILPSKYEGLGIVLIEAQAAGLKCITSEGVVSNEAKISDLLIYYSLKKNAKGWAKKIYETKEYERKNMLNDVVKSGFDVNASIKMVEDFYTSVIK